MPPIPSSENLSRFILDEDHIRKKDGSVKWHAFKPPRNLRLSVYCTSGISSEEIRDIGLSRVAEPQEKPLIGRADLRASVVRANGLDVVSQEPPERHADVINWSDRKEVRNEIAMKLAKNAQFHRNE